MNKVQTLIKETVGTERQQGIFAFTIVPLRNPENLRELKLIVQAHLSYKKGGAKITDTCKPVDLQMTINNLAGRLLSDAKQENFQIEQEEAEAAKKRAEEENTPEAIANAEKEQAEADAAKAEMESSAGEVELRKALRETQEDTATDTEAVAEVAPSEEQGAVAEEAEEVEAVEGE